MISEFPLFVFTTLAGLAAGASIANAVFPAQEGKRVAWVFPLVCLVLLGCGLLGCLGHLARPELFLNGLANPSAGIAQEAYASCAFGALLVAELVVGARSGRVPRALSVVTAVVALALVICMGCAYLENYGTPAWVTWATVPLFVVGDVAMGMALHALFFHGAYGKAAYLGTFVAVEVLLAVTFAALAVHFSSVGCDIVPFVAAIIVGPAVSSAVAAWARTHEKDARMFAIVAFAFAIVGVCIARWAFYAACAV